MVLSELAMYLAAQGIATPAVNLFYGPMKESYPDAVILLQEYGGLRDEPNLGESATDPSESFGRTIRLEFPRIQVLCRGVRDDYDGPRNQAELVRLSLLKVLNQTLSGVWYEEIEALQPPFSMPGDPNFRERIIFNIQVTKAPSAPGVVPVGYTLIDDLGGDTFAFQEPAVSDVYPAGTTYDTLVPDSWPLLLDSSLLPSQYTLEASARVDAGGARVKVILSNLSGGDVLISGSEIVFSTGQLVGETIRSSPFSLPAGQNLIGAKLTVNSTVVRGAAWGIRLLRV